ncbi:MAG TPA: hypothetical protein VMV09_01270 [Candidatus Saccharimonadales bacterium]|nr:hypothetical protein [Candidatus Saccharimonadales bacterium]
MPALRAAALAAVVAVMWAPLVWVPGVVFTRDPAFFSTVHANVSSSLGVLALQGGTSNLSSQGLFYEPYALVELLLGAAGASAGVVSKVLMIAMSGIAVTGSYRVLRHLNVNPWVGVFGAAAYLVNPWSLDQFGYFYLWTGYCLLPTVVLGTVRLSERGRPSATLLIAIVFSGGLIAWLVTALTVGLTLAAHARGSSWPARARRVGWGVGSFGLCGAYWIPPYLAWALHPAQSGFQQFARVSGGLLQSPYPVTDLLALRDFWWPHLEPVAVAGPMVGALASLASTALVLAALGWCGFAWRAPTGRSEALLRSTVLLLLLSGAVLAVGTAGPSGWLYAGVSAWPLVGHSLVRGVLHVPSNFAALFVAGVVFAVAGAVSQACRRPWPTRLIVIVGSCGLALLTCGPSIVSFWQVYMPISPPALYGRVVARIPPGVTMEVGLWHDVMISPIDGVAHFFWSHRMVADPTLLSSFVSAPSLSPALSGNSMAGTQLVAVLTPGGVGRFEVFANRLHVRTLVVENDMVRSGDDPLGAVIARLRGSGLLVRQEGSLSVVSLSQRDRPFVWVAGCDIGSYLGPFGLFHLACPSSKGTWRLESTFNLPTPLMGIGVTIGPVRSAVAGLGTVARVEGQSGWLVSVPGLLAAFGLAVTGAWVGVAVIMDVTRRRNGPTTGRAPGPL